ncbi:MULTISPECIES: ESPR-type extended signal peptide-containing protein [unclassified Variovorax]|uniref:ESPR-type extended signal peptide-containing protein n=1 Tax=unclassified Variovorax TaxID=663243 RepID=UPI003F45CD72
MPSTIACRFFARSPNLMNKSFKSIWNESLGAWVAASELACGRGKRSKSSAAVVVVSALLLAGGVMEGAHGQGTAVGGAGNVGGKDGLAVGPGATAGPRGVAVGFGASADVRTETTAVGAGATTEGDQGTAIGARALSQGTGSIAVGSGTRANGNNNIAFGTANTKSLGEFSIAIGDGAVADGNARQSIAMGIGAKVTGSNTIAIGNTANATTLNSIAIGFQSTSTGDRALAMGSGANASGAFGTALGRLANAIGTGSTALGNNETAGASAGGINSIAIGGESNVALTAASGIAIGARAKAGDIAAIALGESANASKESAMALGRNSQAFGVSATALGSGAQATLDAATATGAGANATGTFSSAFGFKANAAVNAATAIGASANATGTFSSAFGVNANAAGSNAVAIGTGAKATEQNSSALGLNANAAGSNAVAIGTAEASGIAAIAVGPRAKAVEFAIAFGQAAQATSSSSIAIGAQAKASALGATALGTNASAGAAAGGVDSIAIGGQASVASTGASSIAIGRGATVSGSFSIAQGDGATVTGNSAVAVGAAGVARGLQSSVFGVSAAATQDFSTALGSQAVASGLGSTAVGTNSAKGAAAGGLDSIAIGGQSSVAATANSGIAIGRGAEASNAFAIAQGDGAIASGNSALAFGFGSRSSNTGAVAIGLSANSRGVGTVALGRESNAIGDFSVALGVSSVADRGAAVSVGFTGFQRQIINVAEGTTATDALNKGQLDRLIAFQTATVVTAPTTVGGGSLAIASGARANGATGGDFSAIAIGISSQANGKATIAMGEASNATGDRSISIGNSSGVAAANAVALGADATVTSTGAGSVALGQGSIADRANTVSVGTAAAQRQIVNVAAGTATTDAVNVGQLKATNANASAALGGGADVANGKAPTYAVAGGSFNNVGSALGALDAVANKGWNLSANGAASGKVAPGGTVDFINGSNTTVSRSNDNKITVDVSKTPVFESVTAGTGKAGTPGSATLGANGLTTVGKDGAAGPSVTAAGIDAGGKKIAGVGRGTDKNDAANVEQMNEVGAKADNALQYDPKGGNPGKESLTLGGLKPDGTPAVTAGVKLANVADGVAPKDAVNRGQLDTVSATANKGWNLSVNSETTTQNIAPGGLVDFINGSNTTVSRDGSKIKVDVSRTPVFDSVTAGTGAAGTPGSITLGANGLTTVDTKGNAGPSVTAEGIKLGGKKLGGVGAGTEDSDAATVGQVKLAQAQAGNSMQYDGTDRSAATLGGTASKDGGKTGGTKLSNVAQGALNDKSTDAVNGAQLNATNTNASAALGGGADVANGKAPTYAVAGGSFNNVGSALGALDEVASKGWNLSANSADALKIAPGGVVDFINGSNTTVTRTGNKINVDVSKTPVFDSVTVGAGVAGTPGSATLGANGLTTVGKDGTAGPSITATDGINAGGKKIAGVGRGTDKNDAANVEQMNEVGAKADNALQYDPKDGKPGKDSLTLGGLNTDGTPAVTAGVKLANVADGKVAAGSKDAVNGGQLNTVSEIANKGWNLSANGAASGKIAPGDTVDFINGSNTTVTRTGNKINVDVSKTPVFESVTASAGTPGTPGSSSATLGANGLTTTSAGIAGPSVTTDGINAGGKRIAGVGRGTEKDDAANVEQMNEVAAKAGNALQYDPKDGKPGKDSLTLGGLNTDGTPAVTAGVKLANVADGKVAAGSKDAVNGGQLNTVSEIANKGWNLSANGEKTPLNIAPGGVVDFINGSNTTVTRTGNKINVDVSKTPVFDSVTVGAGVAGTPGSATLGANGLTTVGKDGTAGPSVTADGIDAGGKKLTGVGTGTDDTDAANVKQMNAVGAKADNALQYDAKDGKPGKDSLTLGGLKADGTPATAPVKLGNIADGKVAAGSNDAVNGGQLNAVSEIANKGWNLSANSVDALKIAPGGVVDFVNGSNTTVSRTENRIKVDVSKTPTFESVTASTGTPGAPGSSSATLGANGLTTSADGRAGPSVTTDGIHAGDKKLTGVGRGTDGTDAANVEQMNEVGAKADNALQYDPAKDGKPAKESLTLGGLKADGTPATAPVKLGNVADGKVAADSKDAVNGGQLNTLGTGLSNVLGGTYAGGVYTPPTYITVGGGTATTVQGALDNLGKAVSNGTVGPVQRTGRDDQLALVAPGASGAAPGAAQQLTNVKAGTVSSTSSDAVNGSQLHAVNEAVAAVGAKADNALQYDAKDGKPGKESLTLGGLNPDGKPATAPVKLGNVADGNLAAGSKDAVNGGQLFTTNQNVTNLGNDLKTLSTNIDNGKVGPLQRSDTADALVLVGKGATAAAPGAAQRVSNVANGTGAGDAVNFGQLTDVAKTANNSLQYDNADKSAVTMGGTKSTDGGKTGGTKVGNVAQGALTDTSTDAVNGAQLHAANTAVSKALGGGANLNEGKAPSYTVQGKTHDDVGGALGSVNENLTTVNNALNGGGIKYFRANSTLPDAVASGTDAVAVGPNAKAIEAASVAVGSGAKASAVNGTAVGFNAVVQQAGGVALGSGSVASTAAGVAGHVPAGASAEQAAGVRATTSTQGAVSVGDAASGQYRQITGVAAGSADSDAANVAQLKAAAGAAKAGSAQYDTHPDGSTNYGQMTLGNGQAPDGTRIGNVAPGVLPTDAANVGQLNQVKNQLQRQLGDVARVAYSGTAMALAMSGTSLPPMAAGEKAVGVGFGNYKGYSALALTFKALAEDGQMSWGAGLSTTGKEWGVNAGIGWKWR